MDTHTIKELFDGAEHVPLEILRVNREILGLNILGQESLLDTNDEAHLRGLYDDHSKRIKTLRSEREAHFLQVEAERIPLFADNLSAVILRYNSPGSSQTSIDLEAMNKEMQAAVEADTAVSQQAYDSKVNNIGAQPLRLVGEGITIACEYLKTSNEYLVSKGLVLRVAI